MQRAHPIPRIVLLLILALVVLSNVLPGSALAFLRGEYSWLDHAAEFLEMVFPGVDVDHLAAFGALGFAAHFGWPRGRGWQVAVGVLALAALTECVQIWIPGRVASASHAVLDTIGGLAGFGLAWLVTYAWGSESLGRHANGDQGQ